MPRRKRQPTAISYDVTPGTRWWAYLRHSPGPDQDIASQRRALERFAQEQGLTIVRWFIDEAQSGSSLDRDEFQTMIREAGVHRVLGDSSIAEPLVEGILVLDLSRFGRDEVLVPTLMGLFRLARYKVVPVHEHGRLPGGELAAVFESLGNYKNAGFLRDITANTRRGLANVVQQTIVIEGKPVTGFSGGGFAPVGYRAARVETGRRRNGDVRINAYWEPDEMPDKWGETPWIRVQRAWQMMGTGRYTYREIHDACHLYKEINSYNDFFRRRTYLGIRVCGDVEVENAHPAAVDPETFERVQQIMDGRLRPFRHPEIAKSPYLLSGLFVCGYCGESIVGQADPRRPDTRFYMCYTKKRKGHSCRLKRCPAWLLEQAVLDAVKGRALTPTVQAQLLEEINTLLWSGGHSLSEELARTQRQLETVERKLGRVLDLVEEEGKTASLTARLRERERERTELRARCAGIKQQLEIQRPAPVTRDELRGVLAQLHAALTERRTVEQARGVLGQVLVPRESRLFDEAVELHYTFPLDSLSPTTGTGVVPAAGFEPAIFTLKG